MTVFATIMIVLFLVLIGWTWSSLGNIETKTKIICIICGLIGTYIITFIIYNISKIGIAYENQEMMKTIRIVFVILFTIINGYLVLPYIFKKIELINNKEIDKERLIKSIVIVLIIIVILAIFEILYLGNSQQKILNMINSK